MRTRTVAAIAGVGAAAITAVVLVASDRSDPPAPPAKAASADIPARRVPSTQPAGVRVDCSRRSGADFPDAFESSRNLVVGPLVLEGGAESQRPSVIREFGGQKFALLVTAGHTVTVRLPQAERGFAGLAFGGLGKRPLPDGEIQLRDTARTMTFVACRRGEPSGSHADGKAVTFWSGAVVMRAPACVALEIYVDDEPDAHHAMLDMGGRRRCRV